MDTDTEEPALKITDTNGEWTVKIYRDGTMEYGPNYEPDEAARILWEAVQRQARINPLV